MLLRWLFVTLPQRRLKSVLCGLTVVLVCLGYVLLALGIHTKDQEVRHEEARRSQRHLKNAESSETLYDVKKLRPKPPPGLVFDPMARLRGQSKEQREALMKQMGEVEAHRQDVYLNQLRKRGQYAALGGGGHAVYSYPHAPLFFPNVLKHRDFDDWLPRERVWANLTHFPWPQDEPCKTVSVRFARPGSRPAVGMVSYPGSGNTWLRYLVDGATGCFTGSMYNDVYLKKAGLYGEGVSPTSGMTSAVKSHGLTTGPCVVMPRAEQRSSGCNHMRELNSRAVLLIRNPFDAIVSHRNLDAGGHKMFAKQEQFQGEGWRHFVEVKIQSWENLYLDWLSDADTSDLLVVHFETLGSSASAMASYLRRISDFLGFERDEDRLKCVLQHSEGKFHRDRDKQGMEVLPGEDDDGDDGARNKPDPYSEEQKARIRASIDRVDAALAVAGKEAMPIGAYRLYR